MNISGNTILITGGGSGIGRALAEAFHAKGNQVIVAGRRPGALDETTAANPGMRSAVLDIEDRDAIPAFAARIAAEFPTLNVLVNNAGIMRRETLYGKPCRPRDGRGDRGDEPARSDPADGGLPASSSAPARSDRVDGLLRPCLRSDCDNADLLRD